MKYKNEDKWCKHYIPYYGEYGYCRLDDDESEEEIKACTEECHCCEDFEKKEIQVNK